MTSLFGIRGLRRGYQIHDPLVQLDTVRGEGIAVISHAHSDHAPENSRGSVLATPETAALLRLRGYRGRVEMVRHGEWREFPDWRLALLPAGHMLGSAMVMIERSDGRRLLYTGDVKSRPGRTAAAAHFQRADELVIECTFGLPIFRFPPQGEIEAGMAEFTLQCLARQLRPVFAGYTIGKGQEIMAVLAAHGVPMLVHADMWNAARVYTHAGYDFGDALPMTSSNREEPRAWVMPPGEAAAAIARNPGARLCYVSGWALLESRRAGMRAAHMAPLSDHADYYDLHEIIDLVSPSRLWAVHGPYSELFALDVMRRHGIPASTLGSEHP